MGFVVIRRLYHDSGEGLKVVYTSKIAPCPGMRGHGRVVLPTDRHEGMIIMLSTILAIILTAGAPACEYEDGSSQRYCIWNASEQGNGQGQSGIIVKGGTPKAKWIPISHRTAKALTR